MYSVEREFYTKTAKNYIWEMFMYSPTGKPQDNKKHVALNRKLHHSRTEGNNIFFKEGIAITFDQNEPVTSFKYVEFLSKDKSIMLKHKIGNMYYGFTLTPIN
jgi:hypothetical protein